MGVRMGLRCIESHRSGLVTALRSPLLHCLIRRQIHARPRHRQAPSMSALSASAVTQCAVNSADDSPGSELIPDHRMNRRHRPRNVPHIRRSRRPRLPLPKIRKWPPSASEFARYSAAISLSCSISAYGLSPPLSVPSRPSPTLPPQSTGTLRPQLRQLVQRLRPDDVPRRSMRRNHIRRGPAVRYDPMNPIR